MPPRRPPAKRDRDDFEDLRVGLYVRVSRASKCRRCRGSGQTDQGPCPKCEGTGFANVGAGGQEKSTGDQEAVGRHWVERAGARLDERHVYRDPDISASRFATKEREEFTRLMVDLEAGELDVLWVWELSRSQRDLKVFAALRDVCRSQGVRWVIRDRLYDPSDYKDMLTLGILSITGELESEQTSERVTRGKASSALAGRPPGKVPYGYKRIWSRETGDWERDIPNILDGDGLPDEDSPCYIVREVFERIAAGHSLYAILTDLNNRRIPAPAGGRWISSSLRSVATNPIYVGLRVHQVNEKVGRFVTSTSKRPATRMTDRVKAALPDARMGDWPKLVDPETFWTVQSILDDRGRRTTRPGARTGRFLLSGLITCAHCGGPVYCAPTRAGSDVYRYFCHVRGCARIPRDALESYVERVIVAWLSDPRQGEDLAADGDSATAALARADAEQGRVQLRQLYDDQKAGRVSATIATIEERRLLEVIGEAERRERAATRPAVLVDLIGPQAQAGWDMLDLEGRRLIVETVAEIRLRPAHRNGRVPVQDRVGWRWLLGPDAGQEEEAG